MKEKDMIKLTLSTALLVVVLICGMVLPCFFTDRIIGPFAGIFAALVIDILILLFLYPVWFKDYIDEFNKRHGVD